MKRIIYLFFIVLFTSCITTQYQVITHGVDLSRFSDQGFLMTTAEVNKDYKSVAIVSSICTSGTDKEYGEKQEKQDIPHPQYGDVYYPDSNYRQCLLDDVLNELYHQCIDMGANGLIQLEIINSGVVVSASGLAVVVE